VSADQSDPQRPAKNSFIGEHVERYVSSRGVSGHIVDTSIFANPRFSPCLLLRTRGRRSGQSHLAPLTYGLFGREWVVIASKGGAPKHPAWFLNLQSRPECEMQIATQFFRCTWREAVGDERQRVWDYMAGLYPPFLDYERKVTTRVMPVVMLEPREELAGF
jgi:deazaflavin-dependent oxidoreductase (nitroreductase family)